MNTFAKWVLIAVWASAIPSNALSDELAEKAAALRDVKYLQDEYFANFRVEGFQINSIVKDYVEFNANLILCSPAKRPAMDVLVEKSYAEINQIVSFLSTYAEETYNSGETKLTLQFKYEEALADNKCDQEAEWRTPKIIQKINLLNSLDREIAKREAEIVEILAGE